MSIKSSQSPLKKGKAGGSQLVRQNNILRKKLHNLNQRLDEELQKAAKLKVKYSVNPVSLASEETKNQELQNAQKIIERLQKAVRDFESKQAYQVSAKRIIDLESIVKKKDTEINNLSKDIKSAKKNLREQDRTMKQFLERVDKQFVETNINEQKEIISKLQLKIKNLAAQREQLKLKERMKQEKLVSAERKLVELEQEVETPVGQKQELLKKLENYQRKYKEAMQKIEKQNIYITKINTKISQREEKISKMHLKPRSFSSEPERKKGSLSLEELPSLNKSKVKPDFLEHIPSPHIPTRILKRY